MSGNLKVFALGGLHEVGKNCYVLEKNEDIIIVDCGIKFLNGSNLADGTIPNFSYLLENQKKIGEQKVLKEWQLLIENIRRRRVC